MDEEKTEPEEKSETTVQEWIPKTKIGRMVKEGKISNIDEILNKGIKIREPEIVDFLLPNLENDLILMGQSKGKFGGGQRKVFRQTQKKTAEGSRIKFACLAVVGNKDGYVGLGLGSSPETVPAREKAIRNAKMNIIKIKRGCGSWECNCKELHSIPFKISGKCGSVRIEIEPAPKGIGLCIHNELKKILKLAGIEDVWSKTFGETRTRMNLAFACFDALKKLSYYKFSEIQKKSLGIVEGRKE
jgi:small subunit ribosomal protein S5